MSCFIQHSFRPPLLVVIIIWRWCIASFDLRVLFAELSRDSTRSVSSRVYRLESNQATLPFIGSIMR